MALRVKALLLGSLLRNSASSASTLKATTTGLPSRCCPARAVFRGMLPSLNGASALPVMYRPGTVSASARRPPDPPRTCRGCGFSTSNRGSGPSSFPNSGLGTPSRETPVSRLEPFQAETEFRGSAFPNRSLGTRLGGDWEQGLRNRCERNPSVLAGTFVQILVEKYTERCHDRSANPHKHNERVRCEPPPRHRLRGCRVAASGPAEGVVPCRRPTPCRPWGAP